MINNGRHIGYSLSTLRLDQDREYPKRDGSIAEDDMAVFGPPRSLDTGHLKRASLILKNTLLLITELFYRIVRPG